MTRFHVPFRVLGVAVLALLSLRCIPFKSPELAKEISCAIRDSNKVSLSASSWTSSVDATRPAQFYCLCPTRKTNCNADYCDTILTFADPSNQEYNLPNSTWTTARNFMYFLAKQEIDNAARKGEAVPSHFCFMDGDTSVNQPKRAVLEMLGNETELNKIVAFNYRKAYTGAEYLIRADANLNCFAASKIDRYLPYSTFKDDQAWYLSQTDLHIRANIREPFVFKVYNNVVIWNPAHNSDYPRDGIQGVKELGEWYRRQGYSNGCFSPSTTTLTTKTAINCTLNGEYLFSFSFNRTHRP